MSAMAYATQDRRVPNQMRYQTALHPDVSLGLCGSSFFAVSAQAWRGIESGTQGKRMDHVGTEIPDEIPDEIWAAIALAPSTAERAV